MPDRETDRRDDDQDNGSPGAPVRRDGFPEPPDPEKLRRIRSQLDAELARRRAERSGRSRRFDVAARAGQARDIGTYTMIPMLLLAGPAVGYGLGLLLQRWLGGGYWPVVGGVFFGLAAAFRQIYLILAGRTAPPPRPARNDDESEPKP